MSTSPQSEKRIPLSKETVIDAAVALADAGGLEAVSMRAIAGRLGVTAMSIYNHVANKDEILDAMIDRVIGEIDLPERDDWKEAVRDSAISARDVLLRHTWAPTMWLSRQGVGQGRLRHAEWTLATLQRGGLAPETTYHAFHILESHILGATLQQMSFPYQGEELATLARDFLDQLPIETYPHFADHVEAHLAPRSRSKTGFEFALDLILDGLERAG